jgi:hypothetical protein
MAVVVFPTPPFWFAMTIIILCKLEISRLSQASLL